MYPQYNFHMLKQERHHCKLNFITIDETSKHDKNCGIKENKIKLLTNNTKSSQECIAKPNFSASSFCSGVTFPKLTIAKIKMQML